MWGRYTPILTNGGVVGRFYGCKGVGDQVKLGGGGFGVFVSLKGVMGDC